MACAAITGACAALRQSLVLLHGVEQPSAALVKAVLINGCDPLLGAAMPHYESGFGRIDLTNSLLPAGNMNEAGLQENRLTDDDERIFHTLIAPWSGQLRVTLVWTDPLGPLLQNDLDLVVRLHGHEFFGNNGPTINNSAIAVRDKSNNAEKVVREVIASDKVVIEVQASNIQFPPQDFVLVWRVLKEP